MGECGSMLAKSKGSAVEKILSEITSISQSFPDDLLEEDSLTGRITKANYLISKNQ